MQIKKQIEILTYIVLNYEEAAWLKEYLQNGSVPETEEHQQYRGKLFDALEETVSEQSNRNNTGRA